MIIPIPIYSEIGSSASSAPLPPFMAVLLLIIWWCVMFSVIIMTFCELKDGIEWRDFMVISISGFMLIVIVLLAIVGTIGFIGQNF